jgi:leader peptidase (prepilin peptidase)/N-methyltransferase
VTVAAVVALGAFGSLIGSFLNVVIYRVPRRMSLVRPGSACPHCGHAIRWFDNVPVVSWLLLRGRCRDCAAPIPVRYPLIELAGVAAFVPVAWFFLPSGSDSRALVAQALVLAAFLALAAVSVALAAIDLELAVLPNRIVVPALIATVALLSASGAISGDLIAIARMLIGGAALFLLYALLALVPRGMGYGDVKLAALLGAAMAWVGIPALVVGAFAAFILGGIVGVALLIARRAGRGARIPFGPWMLAGAWVGIFAGEPIARWYLGLAGLG